VKLTVDPEFESFIPPLTPAEADGLSASIQAEGRARDPIVVWNDTIVDGHNRYRICTELGLPFATVPMSFESRAAAKQWILDNQIGRRNLTPDQVCMLAAVRGIDPPAGFRGLQAHKLAVELVAAGAPVDRVITGECTVRVAHLRWRESQGDVAPRRVRKASAAPIDSALALRAQKVEQRQEKSALEDALAQLAAANATIDAFAAGTAAPPEPVKPMRHVPTKRTGGAITMLSDVHFGAEFPMSNSTYGNAYSIPIASYRVQRYFAGVEYLVKTQRSWCDLHDVLLWLGGDMVDGHIHPEQIESSLPAMPSILKLKPLIIAGVRQLLEADVRVTIMGSYGNHARDTKKLRHITGARHNADWLLYQLLGDDLRADGVKVIADESQDQYCEFYGSVIHGTHGYSVRYAGGVQGVQVPLNKACAQWDRRRKADIHLVGHLHQLLYGGNWFLNGSVVGYGPHSAYLNCTPEPPQQWFFVKDRKRGPHAMFPVWVSDPAAEAQL